MSTLPKYSIAQHESTQNPLLRLDEGLFAGTVFSFKDIRLLLDSENSPEINFDNEFYNVVVNGAEITLDEHENMNIANIISEELADKLYNEYIFPIFQDLLSLYAYSGVYCR